MARAQYEGVLEIDGDRGVIYFHIGDPEKAKELGHITMLRICKLPIPIPVESALDITHMHGANWTANNNIDVEIRKEIIRQYREG